MKNLFTRSGCNKACFFYSRFSHCRLSLLSFAIALYKKNLPVYIFIVLFNKAEEGGEGVGKITISDIFKNNFLLRRFFSAMWIWGSSLFPLSTSMSAVNKNCTRQPFAKHEFLMHLSFSSALFTLAFLLSLPLSLCFACMHAFCASLHYTPPPQLDDVEEKNFFHLLNSLFPLHRWMGF